MMLIDCIAVSILFLYLGLLHTISIYLILFDSGKACSNLLGMASSLIAMASSRPIAMAPKEGSTKWHLRKKSVYNIRDVQLQGRDANEINHVHTFTYMCKCIQMHTVCFRKL